MALNVLIVDDSVAVQLSLSEQLKHLSISSITCCGTGVSALNAIEAKPDFFDVVFVDLHMPEMDGIELMKRLGVNNFKGAIAIISFIDKRVLEISVELGLSYDMNLLGFLSKPIEQGELAMLLLRLGQQQETHTPAPLVSKTELKQALKGEALLAYFQPQVDVHTGELRGLKIQARLKRQGQAATLPPEQLMPRACELGLQDQLHWKLLELALSHASALHQLLGSEGYLSLEFSMDQLNRADYLRRFMCLLAAANFSPSQIMIEITEQQSLIHDEHFDELQSLRQQGLRFCLDKFGKGFSNISQIRNMPVDAIKLDPSLQKNIGHNKLSQAIISSVLGAAKSQKLGVVITGIDDAADLDYLNDLEASFSMQGDLISKAKPFESLQSWYSCWERKLEKSP